MAIMTETEMLQRTLAELSASKTTMEAIIFHYKDIETFSAICFVLKQEVRRVTDFFKNMEYTDK